MSNTGAVVSGAVRRKGISRGQLLINGKWKDACDGATMNTSDPTTEEVITQVAKGSPADAEDAVNAAFHAFEEGPCPHMHLEERAKLLFRIADLMDERADDFAIRRSHGHGDALSRLPNHHYAALLRAISVLRWPLHDRDEWRLSHILRTHD